MTVRRRKSPEQIVRSLGQADRLLANGADVAAVCRELGVWESTYYRWRERYGGMDVDDARRLKEPGRRTPPSSACWPMPRWRSPR